MEELNSKNRINISKIKTFEEYMEGDHALVHFDSRPDIVIVPAQLKNNPILTLKLSYLFNGKTSFNDKEISSFLKFSGNYFECIIPWETIWGMSSESGEQKIWKESMPKDNIEVAEESKTPDIITKKRALPVLTRIK